MYNVLLFMDNEETYETGATSNYIFPSASQVTPRNIKQGDQYNCQTSTSIPFHTATKQTATLYTISVGVSLHELHKTHARLRKFIHFFKI
jgi:hypothetical protein